MPKQAVPVVKRGYTPAPQPRTTVTPKVDKGAGYTPPKQPPPKPPTER